ncbi:MAG: SDR family NAD(P)-dependent oxidoreductase [Azoarcus sp.]|jgi:acyl transferase domain-containing protein/NAD(P)H-dependent flavin oxidoreductase YrpB (nitropropane dioxygenase family)/NAD(P)-dependent dehydrogenase (short-subunit alcohol dehydrogenase family)|nr:SDR family NAD(P)-dependent oxidoreductase [Azoarcus sp.]
MSKQKEILILSPFELPDMQLAKGTLKAAAFPVLHLGRNAHAAKEILENFAQSTTHGFGVCVCDEEIGRLDFPENVKKIILPFGLNLKNESHAERLVQVLSVEEAQAAINAKAAAIVIKGSEGAGRVAQESSFILFQRVRELCFEHGVKIYIQGGAGVHSSAAYLALGADGVIFDSQVALFPECGADKELKARLGKLSGNETVLFGDFRAWQPPGASKISEDSSFAEILPHLGGTGQEHVIPLGQDVMLAAGFAKRYATLKSLVFAVREAAYGHLRQAKHRPAVRAESDLAGKLGIRYPIAQGPMARVSDTPAFLRRVSEEGAMPFLALGLTSGDLAQKALADASAVMAGLPWGVGILGFAYPQLVEEQIQKITALSPKPRAVVIAGGHPSQAKKFEKAGIHALLHVPSAALLENYLKEGARGFIFEGRESGGHVGPLPSTLLWEKQLEVLLGFDTKPELTVFFAGGIHDACSSAFVSVMAAPLAASGAKVGVLMGTAYLCAEEAVQTGAITEQFQEQAIRADRTVLLESSPGQETRAIPTPYTAHFQREKEKIKAQALEPLAMRAALEEMNLGRARIAAKGLERLADGQDDDDVVAVPVDEQLQRGLFMTGQNIAIIRRKLTMKGLHEDVCDGAAAMIAKLDSAWQEDFKPLNDRDGIAIIGMAGIFPDADNLEEYWRNMVMGRNSVQEVPECRWNTDLFYGSNSKEGDYTVSKWGAFLSGTEFDPLEFGIAPQSVSSIEPVQLLSLLAARRALQDAGIDNLAKADLDNTSVIFGTQAAGDLSSAYGLRLGFKMSFGEVPEPLEGDLPKLTEDSFPGMLSNVVAGRIANRLNCGGRNYSVDAACASSLASLDLACQELWNERSDMVIMGGADLHNSIFDYMMFASCHALSKTGRCATFDAEADGITLGEGVGVVVLKRLEDAERDGNRIYAVIRGVSGSSDGRSLGLTAPNRKGQEKALRRAYADAGILPSEVGMVEAHGTGTVAGDKNELAALSDVFLGAGALPGQTYIGSAKTLIGHTKCAAGVASLIKTALAIHHGILPPTLNLKKPITASSDNSPFVFNVGQASLWNSPKRIAGISGFGFGGTNFHAVLENHDAPAPIGSVLSSWPCEMFVFRGDTLEQAKEWMRKTVNVLEANLRLSLKDVAKSLAMDCGSQPVQASIIAASREELLQSLECALSGKQSRNVLLREEKEGRVAFLFPGQGSQRVNMARELFVLFPSMRGLLERNPAYARRLFPETAFTDEAINAQRSAITDTRNAQPLLGIVDLAIADLLADLGVVPDMAAGHSYGELAALCYAGAFARQDLPEISKLRAESIFNAMPQDKGVMAAVMMPADELAELLEPESEVWAVNYNSPEQTVVGGTTDAMAAFMEKLRSQKIAFKKLDVACAFHTPLLAKAGELFSEALAGRAFAAPAIPVLSNTTTEPYPETDAQIREMLCRQLGSPVLFRQGLERMYEKGARIFIETGPGGAMSGLATATLGKDIVTIQTERNGPEGLRDFLMALARYLSTGRALRLEKLFEGRNARPIDFDAPETLKRSKTAWLLDGTGAISPEQLRKSGEKRPPAKPLISFEELKMAQLAKHGIANGPDSAASREKIVLAYLDNMKAMIDDQRDVMLGYMGHAAYPRMAAAPRQIEYVSAAPEEAWKPEEEEPSTAEAAPPAESAENAAIPHITDLSSEDVKNILLDVVSDKTGYPINMLDMDMDLEADLSIDSIKRLEIISALGERMVFPSMEDMSGLEQIAAIKSLNGLVAWIEEQAQAVRGEKGDTATQDAPAKEAPADEKEELSFYDAMIQEQQALSGTADAEPLEEPYGIARIRVRTEEYPLDESNTVSLTGMRFAITDDGLIADELKARLEKLGAEAQIVRRGAEGFYGLSEADGTVILNLGEADGIVVLNLGISPSACTIQDLFQMVKEAEPEKLRRVIVLDDAPGMAGAQLKEGDYSGLSALQGFPGFIKTLCIEYPEMAAKVVSSMTPFAREKILDLAVAEIVDGGDVPEILYEMDRRMRFAVSVEDTGGENATEETSAILDKDAVVVALGGAQGISPDLLASLAKESRCRFVLAGRTIFNHEVADKYAALGLKTKDDIRKHLIQSGEASNPKETEVLVQMIFKILGIQEALERIEAAGGTAEYHAVDVSDKDALRAFMREVSARYGRVDAISHAAGILEDKLFRDKSWDSFARTYYTKINPLEVIFSEPLPGLKRLVLFSSIAAAVGNRGQCDYASANSVFDTASYILSANAAPVKSISIGWGPWKGAGMVSDALEREFMKRGISLLRMEDGAPFFANEVIRGNDANILAIAGDKDKISAYLAAA